MRKFKFRAWDGKKMFNVDVLAISPCGWASDGTGVSLAYQPHIKVMQYTGLTDKNGKEIYEGDIIDCNYMGFSRFNAVVRFGEYIQDGSGGEYSGTECIGFYTDALNKDQTDEWDIKKISDYMETTSLLTFEEIEVIGNIYENPNLLEVSK